LPPSACSAAPEYYVSALTTEEGLVTDPPGAPQAVYRYGIGVWAPSFADDFEQDRGWIISPGATGGNWERADPEQVISNGVITQPEDDHTPGEGHLCFVTGAAAGSGPSANDVDGGPSILLSPAIDLSSGDGLVGYWRWFHISVQMDDALVVAVSNDDANWVTVEQVSHSAQAWSHAQWRVSDYVTPSATVRVRFTIDDTDPGSILESLIDDFTVQVFTCADPMPGDLDCDGVVNSDDVSPFVLALVDPTAYQATYPGCTPMRADMNEDGVVDGQDIQFFVNRLLGP
jgi:hypothetical protein